MFSPEKTDPEGESGFEVILVRDVAEFERETVELERLLLPSCEEVENISLARLSSVVPSIIAAFCA